MCPQNACQHFGRAHRLAIDQDSEEARVSRPPLGDEHTIIRFVRAAQREKLFTLRHETLCKLRRRREVAACRDRAQIKDDRADFFRGEILQRAVQLGEVAFAQHGRPQIADAVANDLVITRFRQRLRARTFRPEAQPVAETVEQAIEGCTIDPRLVERRGSDIVFLNETKRTLEISGTERIDRFDSRRRR